MNNTLYVLTLASVSIMPIQLLTGLYGMNFETDRYASSWRLLCDLTAVGPAPLARC